MPRPFPLRSRALRRRLVAPIAAAALSAACSSESAPSVTLGPVDGRDLPAVDTGRVRVGSSAPDFSLQSFGNGIVTLSDYRGKKDIVLVFYRGSW